MNRYLLLSEITEGPDKGYWKAVKPEREDPSIYPYDDIYGPEEFRRMLVEYAEYLASLPFILVSPEYGKKIGAGNYFDDWEEKYQLSVYHTNINRGWRDCTKEEYDKQSPSLSYRKTLVERKQSPVDKQDWSNLTGDEIAEKVQAAQSQKSGEETKDEYFLAHFEFGVDKVTLRKGFPGGSAAHYIVFKIDELNFVELDKHLVNKAAPSEKPARDRTCAERDDLKAQVKALSAIKRGLESSLSEAFEIIKKLQSEPQPSEVKERKPYQIIFTDSWDNELGRKNIPKTDRWVGELPELKIVVVGTTKEDVFEKVLISVRVHLAYLSGVKPKEKSA